MSNLTVNFNIKTNDKIIIEDESDDSFLSTMSKSSTKETKTKSLFNKLGKTNSDIKNNVVLKNKMQKNNNKYTKRQSGLVINETKSILEKSYINYQQTLEKYYDDVLEWMNAIYNDNSKSILKVQLKKITLDEDIFNKYNEIIKKYKLKKDLFDIENFNFEDGSDYNLIVEIAKIMTKNLVEKLNYKLDVINNGKTKQLKIKNLSKEI
jgi:hypothetical protein